MLKKPCSRKHHKTVRLNRPKKMIPYGTIFSDEIK